MTEQRHPVENRYPIENPDRTLGDLVGDLTSEIAELVSSHVELAMAEIRQDARDAGRAGGMFGAAGVSALVCVLMLSMAAAWGLAEVIEPGWAFLLVGGIWAVAAAVLTMSGKRELDDMDPGPQRTIEEIKEDRQWIENQTR